MPKTDVLSPIAAKQFRIALRAACDLAGITMRSLGDVPVSAKFADARTRDYRWVDNQLCESRALPRINALELGYRWMFHPEVARQSHEEIQNAIDQNLTELRRLQAGETERGPYAPPKRTFLNAHARMNKRILRGYDWTEPRLLILPKQIRPLSRGMAKVAATSRRQREKGLAVEDRLAKRFEEYLTRNARAIVGRGLQDFGSALQRLNAPKARRALQVKRSLMDVSKAGDVVGDLVSILWSAPEWATPPNPDP